MTTISELFKTLGAWTRWMRAQRALTWSLRGFIFGLGVSLLGGLAGLWFEKIVKFEFMILLTSGSLVLSLLAGIVAYLWKIQLLQAARKFDTTFHLKERISTALELAEGKTRASKELIAKQLTDALNAARKVNPARDFGLSVKKREILYALVLIIFASLTWLRGERLFAAAQQARTVQYAVQAQETKVEEIIKAIETNSSLTEEQKKALTTPLNEALQELNNDPSLEGSVSTLTSAGEKLQAMSDSQVGQTAQALQESGKNISEQKGSPLEGVGEKLANGDTIGAANDLQNLDLSKLSASELEQLANQLSTMADAIASTNPQLAEKLNQAAEAINNGNTVAAQQALSEASQAMTQAGQQQIMNQAAQQAGTQLQQGAGQVLVAGGGQQGSTQSGNQADGSGSGSGTGEANGESNSGGQSSNSQQNNGAGDGGESTYEQIYAPSLLGGENNANVTLPSAGTDGEVVGTGPVSASDDGNSVVPYNEVFSQYEDANQQAMDNGDVPFQFMTIIRNYFDSLKP